VSVFKLARYSLFGLHWRGVECIYDHEKKKPGFKVGAVESLSRRLGTSVRSSGCLTCTGTVQLSATTDVVEQALSISRQTAQVPPTSNHVDSSKEYNVPLEGAHQFVEPFAGVLNSLTKELHNLNATISATHRAGVHHTTRTASPELPLLKRRRGEAENSYARDSIQSRTYPTCTSSSISTSPWRWLDTVMGDVVDSYFRCIHPWISIIHEPSFRSRIQDDLHKERLKTVVQSMAVAALRFCKQSDEYISPAIVEERTTQLKREVTLTAWGRTSIENIQALLILIYVDIAGDSVMAASSLLAVVWRQIESLELHLEVPTQTQVGGVFEKTCLKTTNVDWMEREEWRRMFWNAFMLDRLCAALLGHKPTFLGASTSQRLPVCSSFWYTNQPRPTPYLNIYKTWNTGLQDASTLDYSSFAQHISDTAQAGPFGTISPTSGVGSLAYYVEAMDSMGLVLSHFLSLEVNFSSKSDVSRWLTRFKELDLHLLR
jgi:hypothetical protein